MLYNNNREILIASCIKIDKIQIETKRNEECLKEIPTKIWKGDKNLTLYLTDHLILKTGKLQRFNCNTPIFTKIEII